MSVCPAGLKLGDGIGASIVQLARLDVVFCSSCDVSHLVSQGCDTAHDRLGIFLCQPVAQDSQSGSLAQGCR